MSPRDFDIDPSYEFEEHLKYVADDVSSGWTSANAGQLRALAMQRSKKLLAQGAVLSPVSSSKRTIASSGLGQAWCRNLELFQDCESRLQRGRTYLRNGAVLSLEIEDHTVRALVSGSELYEVQVSFEKMSKADVQRLSNEVLSSLSLATVLLNRAFSSDELAALIRGETSPLLPRLDDLSLSCNCLDYAQLCKHAAATLYGIGVLLDTRPELLFLLRGLDPNDLLRSKQAEILSDLDKLSAAFQQDVLEDLFGIELSLTPRSFE